MTSEPRVMRELRTLDRALVAHQWPALTAFWLEAFAAFMISGLRQLVARVGRRGGKSSSLCRFAVAFVLAYDPRLIPPGDLGVVAFISTRSDEAAQRLRTIKAILGVIGLEWKPIADGIELVGLPFAFKVYPASIAGVSGFTAILVICDEVAKWRDAETGSNPATDVLASVRPTMATQPLARIILASSPLTHEDAHAKAFEEGTTSHQTTAFAETWVANPTITEQQTRDDEPDPRVWAREYAAIPQASKLAAFDDDAVSRAFDHPRPTGLRMRRRMIVDLSSGKKDRTTWGICGWVMPERKADFRPYLLFDLVDGTDTSFWRELTATALFEKLASVAKTWNVGTVHADQREEFMARAEAERYGLDYRVHNYTGTSKPAAVERVRRWLAEGCIALPRHERLEYELRAFEERVLPSGQLTFGARASGHDDFACLLLTAALAELQGGMVGAEEDCTLMWMNTSRWDGDNRMHVRDLNDR